MKNKIKNLRENKGITQEDFAGALKVSRQTVIAMEKGNYEPSLGLALKVAKFFDMPVEKIFIIN
ncbi:MAG: helix-turn-helix transcriptional regulator [Candidatus Magasanikbacteria bacterium]|nr:helix-turn-helix transcriptional regulator [Candidatus Magasanikbacteria bacterium]